MESHLDFVELDSVKLAYSKVLNVEEYSREHTPLVWGHCLCSSMENEDERGVFDWCHANDWTTPYIRYDSRGHGKSHLRENIEHPAEEFTWPRLGQDMVAIADKALGPGAKFIPGGSSMGCATALYAAVQHPERIKALLLVIPPTWETRPQMVPRYVELAEMLEKSGLASYKPQHKYKVLEEHPRSLAEPDAKCISLMQLQGVTGAFRGAALSNYPPDELIQKIDVPTLILAWEGDRWHPESSATRVHGLIATSRLEIARSYQDFQKWPALIQDFLAQHA